MLIDHILVSQGVTIREYTLWNPYYDHKNDARNAQVNAIRDALRYASDHFPVSALLELT